MELSPAAILSMWAAGVAGAAAVVRWWDIVGRGFTWLVGGTVLLLALPALAFGVSWWVIGGAVAAGVALVAAESRNVATTALLVATTGLVTAAALDASVVGAFSGALILGAITVEMMLGHWYLVDPTLPRWALRRLAAGAAVAAGVDVAVSAAMGAIPWASGDVVVGIGYLVLALTTVVLMVLVDLALREPGYSGVMAATGLSYLATLTGIGVAIVGRLLADGPVLG